VSGDIIELVRAGRSDFLVAEIRHFFYLKKSPKQHDQVNILENFFKKCSHVEEEASYEITKIFWENLGEISNFFLLKSSYLVNRF
jgi:hypothetical protein